jgi:hypothetical protein
MYWYLGTWGSTVLISHTTFRKCPQLNTSAYWVALNDFQATTFTQLLGIGSATSSTLPYTTVAVNNYSEVYLGEFVLSRYQPYFNIYLTAANNTTSATNALVCDYIKIGSCTLIFIDLLKNETC